LTWLPLLLLLLLVPWSAPDALLGLGLLLQLS
jgi:hypothetical protein